jgi:4-azaleucine resistance transporter AzlC
MTDTARETWRVRWRVTGREISRDPVLRDVWGACLTLGIAVGVFAIAFGVSAVAAGASVTQTCAMSLLVFTGASQLSAISVIGAGGSSLSAFGGAALLAARNGVYGLAMSRRLNGSLGVRLVAAQLTIDESTAMSASQTDAGRSRAAFWITGIGVYVFWNIGTLIGALAGQAIDPRTFGLDAAFPAAYVAMVWPLLADRRSAIAAALGATICLVLIPVTPVGVPILCAAVAVLIGVRR